MLWKVKNTTKGTHTYVNPLIYASHNFTLCMLISESSLDINNVHWAGMLCDTRQLTPHVNCHSSSKIPFDNFGFEFHQRKTTPQESNRVSWEKSMAFSNRSHYITSMQNAHHVHDADLPTLLTDETRWDCFIWFSLFSFSLRFGLSLYDLSVDLLLLNADAIEAQSPNESSIFSSSIMTSSSSR